MRLTKEEKKEIIESRLAGYEIVEKVNIEKEVAFLLKCDDNFSFAFLRNEADHKFYINYGENENIKSRFKYRVNQLKETYSSMKKQRDESLKNTKVNDFYVSSWGYEQTNVNFYQVIKRNKTMLELREVEKDEKYDSITMTGTCRPIKDSFRNDYIYKCRIRKDGTIKISDSQVAKRISEMKDFSYSTYA